MARARIAALIAAATIIGIAAAACDDDEDGDGEASTPPATQPAAPTAASTVAAAETPAGADAAAAEQAVVAENFTFEPATFSAVLGESLTVTLQNGDQVPHTLTVYEGAEFATPVPGADTGNVAGGASGEFTATFAEAKTYAFRCEVHNNMQGTITVE